MGEAKTSQSFSHTLIYFHLSTNESARSGSVTLKLPVHCNHFKQRSCDWKPRFRIPEAMHLCTSSSLKCQPELQAEGERRLPFQAMIRSINVFRYCGHVFSYKDALFKNDSQHWSPLVNHDRCNLKAKTVIPPAPPPPHPGPQPESPVKKLKTYITQLSVYGCFDTARFHTHLSLRSIRYKLKSIRCKPKPQRVSSSNISPKTKPKCNYPQKN